MQPLRSHSERPRHCLAAVPVGGGGAWPDNKPTRRTAKQRPGPTGVEGTGGTGGPGCGARERWRGLAEAGGADTTASQISHVIYRGHFSRCPKNVAIPTTQMQCLNNSSRNYVRNYWLSAIAGHQGNAPSNIRHEGPTGVKGAGGAGGPGCGAHGRWRGLAGLRGDAPSEARGADGSRAGAAHGHTKQPGLVGPQAARATGTHSGQTQRRPAARGHTKPPDPTGAGRFRQSARGTQRRITTMSGSPRPLS